MLELKLQGQQPSGSFSGSSHQHILPKKALGGEGATLWDKSHACSLESSLAYSV
jgi:hypothetical protein